MFCAKQISEYCERILFIEIAKDILEPPLGKVNAAASYSRPVYCFKTQNVQGSLPEMLQSLSVVQVVEFLRSSKFRT